MTHFEFSYHLSSSFIWNTSMHSRRSLENHTRFQTKMCKIYTQLYPISDWNDVSSKFIPSPRLLGILEPRAHAEITYSHNTDGYTFREIPAYGFCLVSLLHTPKSCLWREKESSVVLDCLATWGCYKARFHSSKLFKRVIKRVSRIRCDLPS